jgi:peptidoglycan/LPS O-acetylase OafA/YrhL
MDTKVAVSRFEPLDWQRGLLALSIMLYHLIGWEFSAQDSGSLIGRLGVYGVSMFFVLSGLSMAVVYSGYVAGSGGYIRFFVRRIFRIWPLLWIATFVVVAGNFLIKNEVASPSKIFLNLTTLFGFLDPGAYMVTGAWSIGNEMVYYAITPALLALYNRSVAQGNIAFLISLMVGGYFAAALISPDATLAAQWNLYINPFNNLFLYVAGIAIYYNSRNIEPSAKLSLILISIACLVFAFFPADGDQAGIVTGLNRLVFSAASILMVAGFFKVNFSIPPVFSVPLEKLGIATYGVYLLHPIVYAAFGVLSSRLGIDVSPLAVTFLVSAITIAVALLVYALIETPMIRLGKRLTSNGAPAVRAVA